MKNLQKTHSNYSRIHLYIIKLVLDSAHLKQFHKGEDKYLISCSFFLFNVYLM